MAQFDWKARLFDVKWSYDDLKPHFSSIIGSLVYMRRFWVNFKLLIDVEDESEQAKDDEELLQVELDDSIVSFITRWSTILDIIDFLSKWLVFDSK